MKTKVYCIAGYLQRFYKVEPEIFIAEVQRQLPEADVVGIFPIFRDWATQPGRHTSEVDSLLQRLKVETEGFDRIVLIGFSVGGHLAALLGNLLPATHVLAYAPPTDLYRINLGSKANAEFLDPRYCDLRPHCQGLPKMLLIADQTQRGRKNSHNPRQVRRLRRIPNSRIVKRYGLDFENEYFPSGKFSADLLALLA